MQKPSVEKQLEKLMKLFERQNERIDRISKILDKIQRAEQPIPIRAKTEQLAEQSEQMLDGKNLSRITGRHRELLALLINQGYHTYFDIAKKMNISQSRARAYVAELKNNFGVPLRQIRDPEGYKIGIDIRFVEQILSLK